jgi:DNA-binding XRE family transcriptional regulator
MRRVRPESPTSGIGRRARRLATPRSRRRVIDVYQRLSSPNVGVLLARTAGDMSPRCYRLDTILSNIRGHGVSIGNVGAGASSTGEELSAKLRRLRHARFLSQAELAKRAGVSAMTVKRLESGLTQPYGRTIRLLAAALAVEPSQLASPREVDPRKRIRGR